MTSTIKLWHLLTDKSLKQLMVPAQIPVPCLKTAHIHDLLPCSLLPRWGASGALGCWSSAGISPWRQPASYSHRWLGSSSSPPPSPRPPAAPRPTQTCHPACSCHHLSSPSSGERSRVRGGGDGRRRGRQEETERREKKLVSGVLKPECNHSWSNVGTC